MRNIDGDVLEFPTATCETDGQENQVYDVLSINRLKWLTLSEISEITGIPSTSSIASRIRDLRTKGVRITKRICATLSQGRSRTYQYMMEL